MASRERGMGLEPSIGILRCELPGGCRPGAMQVIDATWLVVRNLGDETVDPASEPRR